MEEIPDSEFDLAADLVLLAMGYVHPLHDGLLADLGVQLDQRGNVLADDKNYQTSAAKVFSAGDTRRGQSLVVWAIREGTTMRRARLIHFCRENLYCRNRAGCCAALFVCGGIQRNFSYIQFTARGFAKSDANCCWGG